MWYLNPNLINNNNEFFNLSDNDSQISSDEWPPFRRVGNFDPFTDDPRYAEKMKVQIVIHFPFLVIGLP